MPNSNTKITLKRTTKNAAQVSSEPLFYGEPAFIEEGKYLSLDECINAFKDYISIPKGSTIYNYLKDLYDE